MTDDAMPNENRRYQRYAIKGDILITSRPLFHTVGKLRDISYGGVGFEYVANSENARLETVEVDMLFRKQFQLRRIPCRVAYDISVEQPPAGGVGTRRCGLEFRKLSDQQASLLSLIFGS